MNCWMSWMTWVFLRSSMLIRLKPGKCVVMAVAYLEVNTGSNQWGKRWAWRDNSSGILLLGSPAMIMVMKDLRI